MYTNITLYFQLGPNWKHDSEVYITSNWAAWEEYYWGGDF